jgi:UDP-N-acetylglucosamine acyltransferase
VAEVHPTAIVEAGAELDTDVSVGPYSIVGANVRVGARTCVGSHTILEGWSEIGPDCQIGSHVIIGAPPQDLKYGGEATRVVIEERVIVREFASIHRASTGGEGVTRVGAHAYLMAYVHIAHNCQVGPHVVMANLASLAGHVEIGEHANIGGMAGIHQFVRIGAHAFVGACSAVLQDIPPYVKVQGNRAKPFGLNVVGLRRHGLSREALQALKEAYRIVFESELNTSQALEQLTIGGGAFPEVQRFVEFIQRSRRGISK